ncbi:hypothetical protein SVI_2780 [Shewanella violacea DSS12]|uniref:Uncharacterized protein n=1 Tax=Shewanella violacea (strain JCM 10179 / CIP 106290 / LMG 19151 / DSS12) TaxID=637905 RepID=D4ZM52_SHEVD|nr:hypothetical protein SVI_2780 [Shewanella violacea DSS12]
MKIEMGLEFCISRGEEITEVKMTKKKSSIDEAMTGLFML